MALPVPKGMQPQPALGDFVRPFALLVIDLRQRIDAAQPGPPHAARDLVVQAMLAFGNNVGA